MLIPDRTDILLAPAKAEDGPRLAEIRVDAMRPSLEALDRFDPVRARERFLGSFAPPDTRLIEVDGDLVGFVVVRRREDHLYLDHLYLRPNMQGVGRGKAVVKVVLQEARDAGLPVRLMALRGSRANAFYESCGFRLTGSDSWDNHYEWRTGADPSDQGGATG